MKLCFREIELIALDTIEVGADEVAALHQQAAELKGRLVAVGAVEILPHQLGQRLALMVRRHVEHAGQRLTSASRHALFRNPRRLVDQSAQRLDETVRRLRVTMPRRLDVETSRLDAMTRQLGAVNPGNVLQRGYSYTLGPDGNVLRRIADTRAGQRITTVLADGRIASIVETGSPDDTPGNAPPMQTKRRRVKKPDAGPGLFAADSTE